MTMYPQVASYPPAPRRSRLPWILAGAVVAALAVLTAAIIYAVSRDEDITARWETSSMMTSNPWTPSIVKPGAPINAPGNFVGAVSISSVAAGDDCDKEALKKHLASNPKLANNWADILGIGVTEINGYIDRLQSRRLAVPVQVTNHDYEGDAPRKLQSVLDVGTAVLTDADGTPRVRCACGNPLKPATTKATKFDNLPPGADPGAIVTDPTANSNNGTTIRVIGRPLVKTSSGTQPAPGYTVKDEYRPYVSSYGDCYQGKPSRHGKSTALCGSTPDQFNYCWPDGPYAYCVSKILDTELRRFSHGGWDTSDSTEIADFPAALELADGTICSARHGGAWSSHGDLNGWGGCDNRTIVWGPINRSSSTWTVQTAPDTTTPLTTLDVRIAYYAVDE